MLQNGLTGCLIDKACQLIDGLIMGWYQRMKACIGDGKRDIISAGMIYPTDMDDGVGGKLVVQEGHLVRGCNVVPVGGVQKHGLTHHIRGKGIDPVTLILIVAVNDDGIVNVLGVEGWSNQRRSLCGFAAIDDLI